MDSIPTSSTGCSSSTSRNWSLTRHHPLLVLGHQVLGHHGRHERRHVAPEARHLSDELRRHERVLRAGRDEDRLDAREMVVHLGHLHLGLEVRHGAQPPHDRRGADVARHVDQERRDRDDPHRRQVRHDLFEHRLALLEIEERGALRGLRSAATTTSSKRRLARSTISRCPLWKGSNDPGKRPTFTSRHRCDEPR